MYEYKTSTSVSPDDTYLVNTAQETYGWEFIQVIKHEEQTSPHSSKMYYVYWFRREKQNEGEFTVKFQ